VQYVLIHGLGQTSSSWDKTISYMLKPFNVVCPSLSALLNGGEVTYASLYKAFDGFCNQSSEPLHLCGLSLGGVLALNYAIENPAKVKSLVLIGAQYKMPGALLKVQNIIFRILPKAVFKNMEFEKNDFIRLTKSMIDINFSDKIINISCPALIMCGEKDSANMAASKQLAAKIPGAELHILDSAGHEANINNPKLLAQKLESFWMNHLDP